MLTAGMVLKAWAPVQHFAVHRLARTAKSYYSASNVNNAKI